jgi:polygalacturonase
MRQLKIAAFLAASIVVGIATMRLLAAGEGLSADELRLQRQIDEASARGGGCVVVSAGREFLI